MPLFSVACFVLACRMANGVDWSFAFVMECIARGVLKDVPNAAYSGVDECMDT